MITLIYWFIAMMVVITTYYHVTGVRYAKPPVGKLRFKKTEEAEGWKGVEDAKAPGSICPQIDPSKQ